MSDNDFVRNSVLDILVPEVTDVNIEEALNSSESVHDGNDSGLITSIQQRRLLYFDEDLPLYVVLRSPYEDLDLLKTHISRLAIALEAHAISSPAAAASNEAGPVPIQSTGQARDVVWSSRLDVSEDPIIVVEGSDDNDDQDVLLIWKMNAFLSRPRVRLHAPAIIFKVSASLQPIPLGNTKSVDEYLPSGVPFPINVLQPLGNDSSLEGRPLQLPASRLSRVIPSSRPNHSEVLPLKVFSRRAFQAIPAISSRLRYHRCHGSIGKSAIIASLEMDIPVFAQHHIELTKIVVKFQNGEVQEMMGSESLQLPMTCRARDSITCLYSLIHNVDSSDPATRGSSLKSLDVMIDARVLVSKECRPRVEIRWKQSIDFATTLNPNFGRAGRSMHRNNRPANLSTSSSHTRSASQDMSKFFTSGEMGLSATITGKESTYVGEPFKWDVFVVNRARKTRRFALSMLPKRRPGEGRRKSRPGSSSSLPGSHGGVLADAVVDENILYTIIKSQSSEPTQLVSLSSDVQTGPMVPGSCYSTELEFLPLAKGPLYLEAIRVLDLDSNEIVDLRDLPDIMPIERGEG